MGFEPHDNEDETFTEADWLEMLAQTGPSDTFSNEAGITPITR